MIKTPKRHCMAMSSNYMPNFINVSGIVLVLWHYNQSGTPARPSPPARRRPPAHRTDNFSKSDNNTLRQILAEGKNGFRLKVRIQNFLALIAKILALPDKVDRADKRCICPCNRLMEGREIVWVLDCFQ